MGHFGKTLRALRQARRLPDPRDAADESGLKLATLIGYEESDEFRGYEKTLGTLLRYLDGLRPIDVGEFEALEACLGADRLARLGIEAAPSTPARTASPVDLAREIERLVGRERASGILAAVLESVRALSGRPVAPAAIGPGDLGPGDPTTRGGTKPDPHETRDPQNPIDLTDADLSTPSQERT